MVAFVVRGSAGEAKCICRVGISVVRGCPREVRLNLQDACWALGRRARILIDLDVVSSAEQAFHCLFADYPGARRVWLGQNLDNVPKKSQVSGLPAVSQQEDL